MSIQGEVNMCLKNGWLWYKEEVINYSGVIIFLNAVEFYIFQFISFFVFW